MLKNTAYLLNIGSNSNPLALNGKEGEIFQSKLGIPY